MAPLNEWVRELRARLGAGAIVPWFDPADGGIRARILWLLEAPGPKATKERGGSGIVSCNNNDQTAQNTWETRVEAQVSRLDVVHWNAIPYYLGTSSRIRSHVPSDVSAVGPLMAELLALLPRLQVVVLGGSAARKTWDKFGPKDLKTIDSPHPSPTNVNTRPGTREAIVKAWRSAQAVLETKN
ncbi:MAG TPA: uracil-DNA glycosylase [Candidatus Acidoferrum sp.]|nr:uracil-DNA glycosylase [Candidatus Acidoferrum sp.]